MVRSPCSTRLPSPRRARRLSIALASQGSTVWCHLSVQPIPYQFIDGAVHIRLYLQSAHHPIPVNQFLVNSPMSTPPTLASGSHSKFQTIFHASLRAYQKQTKKDLLSHPLAAQLDSCDSPAAILAVLQDQVQEFEQSQSVDDRLTKWLDPTINVLYAFSATLGEGVGLVFSF
ncbi:hypothetical protein EDB86DRAFT_1496745 [Lactarius hatsudake]|nr:hypothetical protein EDB86DRAFT_1496745 [Lactarius hatsudake]